MLYDTKTSQEETNQTSPFPPSNGKKRSEDISYTEPIHSANTPALDKYGHTHRGLKSRHVQLIALGGCIGTGLFVGTGSTLSLTGGANLFMAFVAMSFIIWCVMNSLAEMTAYLPVTGTSPPFYINRFFKPSLALPAAGTIGETASSSGGDIYLCVDATQRYAYSTLVAAEISAASVVIEYWTTKGLLLYGIIEIIPSSCFSSPCCCLDFNSPSSHRLIEHLYCIYIWGKRVLVCKYQDYCHSRTYHSGHCPVLWRVSTISSATKR